MPIGLEHLRFLGRTLSAIAGEKAGIIKEGRPIVSAKQSPAALRVIKAVAAEKKAPFYLAGGVRGLTISLPGSFQAENAAVACLALKAAGIEVSDDVLRPALKDISWPGRLQVVSRRPLIIFDVSHNPPAVKTLIANLAGLYPGRKTTFLFGVLKDKDYLLMLKYLGDYGKRFFFTRPCSDRARDPKEVEKNFRLIYPDKKCRVVLEPKDAFREAKKGMEDDGLLCICGSFYLAPVLQAF
jgi:dihydrofolate synthase/folylpolyglutamate synthase